jgi:hypothetical protein
MIVTFPWIFYFSFTQRVALREANVKKIIYFLCSVCFVLMAVTACSSSDDDSSERAYQSLDFEAIDMPDGFSYFAFDGTNLAPTGEDEYNIYAAFTVNDASFATSYSKGWSTVSGFTISSSVDMQTEGYLNQYSVYAPSGNNESDNFAILYSQGEITFQKPSDLRGIYVNNTTYAYLAMKNGTQFSNPLETTHGIFEVVFTGYDSTGNEIASVVKKLGDYQTPDNQNEVVAACGENILNRWDYLDLSPLVGVESVIISFDSTDIGEYGIVHPLYVAIDDLEVYE